MTKRLILALLFFCSPLWATTYYVDNCVSVGSDRNNGASTSTPWLTINKVDTSKFNPGDSILFESTCTWREQLTVPSSGSAGSPITFGAYGTGATPIITSANLFTSWTLSSGSVYYTSYSTAPNQVFEDGSRLTQNTVSYASLTAGQWYLDTGNSRIWVYLTAGDNPGGHTMEASQLGSAVNTNSQSYVTISNLDLEEANGVDLYANGGSNVIVSGVTANRAYSNGILFYVVPNGTVTQSTVMYSGASGISGLQVPNWLVDHVVANYNSQLSVVQYTSGIHMGVDSSGQSTNATIQYSEACFNGVGQGSTQGAGIWPDTIGAGFIARYNLACNNNLDGITIDAFNGAKVYGNLVYSNGNSTVGSPSIGFGINAKADQNTSLTGTSIYGNTVWGNYEAGIAVSGPYPEQTNGCTGNTVENNISLNSNSGVNLQAIEGCENPGTYGSGNVYAYNAFGAQSTNFIEWGYGNLLSTYSAWETATGNCGTTGCSHSVEASPGFANASASQFWLTSGSPGIGAGVNLGSSYNVGLLPGSTWPTGVTTGPTNTPPDVGAFVYVPLVALNPPSNLLVLSVH